MNAKTTVKGITYLIKTTDFKQFQVTGPMIFSVWCNGHWQASPEVDPEILIEIVQEIEDQLFYRCSF